MKRLLVCLLLFVPLSCAMPFKRFDRTLMAAEMWRLTEMEKKFGVISSVIVLIDLPEEKRTRLKEAYDIYFVLHEAAMQDLADGDLYGYRARCANAMRELETMALILKSLYSTES